MHPIEKIGLSVHKNGGQLVLVSLHHLAHGIESVPSPAPADAATGIEIERTSMVDIDILVSQNYLLQHCIDDMRNELTSVLDEHRKYMTSMNSNLCQFCSLPFCHSPPYTQWENICEIIQGPA